MKKEIELEEAQSILENNINSFGIEKISIILALKRVLAVDIYSPIHLPPFDRSAVDGFAIRAQDTEGASKSDPVILNVIKEIYAGDNPQITINKFETARIMTGAPTPKGADCIIRQEAVAEDGKTAQIFEVASKWDNYCFAGEDIKKGDLILKKGTLLNYASIGILSSLGFEEILVYKNPRIAVLSTGNELIDAGQTLSPGKIYNSNLFTIGMRLKEFGFEPNLIGNEKDDMEKMCKTIKSAVGKADILITTGGVSVGKKDIMKDVMEKLGATNLFWKINIKPGTPVLCSILNGTLVISLSGNPAASIITFELLVRLILAKCAHRNDLILKKTEAILTEPFFKESKRRRFLRGKIQDDGNGNHIALMNKQSSGVLSSILNYNCLIDIPANTPNLIAGQTVDLFML